MRIDEIELRTVHVPFRTPFTTSFGVVTGKTTVLATVRSDGVEGYGEGVMMPLPVYREETLAGARSLLREVLAPDLIGAEIGHPDDLQRRWSPWRGNPMAKATLEMAVWDCWARQHDTPLATLLGGSPDPIPVGASLSIGPTQDTVDAVGAHLDEGYRRIKLKITPGHDLEVVEAVRSAHPESHLTVDANSAYTLDQADTLRALDRFGLAYVEQPLHWDDLTDHAALAATMRTPICLDESITSLRRVRAALDLGAGGVINMKVGRVGGHGEARRIHDLCVERNVPLWCGGMLETGVGRAHNIHLATLPGFTMPGDTASASRTYDIHLVNEPLEAERGMMAVPPGPGIGVTLDTARLAACTVDVETIRR